MDKDRISKLTEELQKGNMEYFDEFYDLTKRGVFSMAYSILHNKEDSENVMQDTYLKFLERLPHMKKDKSVLAYLMQTAKNLSLNIYKTYQKRDASYPIENISEEMKIEDDTIMNVMKKVLKPKERQIVLMHCLYDMTHKEIASTLHRPIGSITWAYNNAIKKLQEALKDVGY